MKVLLVGINAKYVQTNLAIRLLEAYSRKWLPEKLKTKIDIKCREWNINQPLNLIVQGIFLSNADVVLFSTYVWNKTEIIQIAEDLRKIMPNLVIGFGGPEVSWAYEKVLNESNAVNFIIVGEGEKTIVELLSALVNGNPLGGIPGLCLRGSGYPESGTEICIAQKRIPIDNLDTIPNPYINGFDDINPQQRIIYYESSRGCPFSCAYCLSSLDCSVRYYSLERVFADVSFFLKEKIPLVKFVDRTFNLQPDRYLAIWKYIRDNYNGITTFHFEIHAEVLCEESFDVLKSMPEGSIQFEIGIQSINQKTLQSIHRCVDITSLEKNIRRIPKSIHTHVDLIAGLPHEDLASFKQSFDFAFFLNADMVQLGFLKILAGTEMEKIAHADRNYKWSDRPPYEVLASPKVGYNELILLKRIDHVVDVLFNSGLMVHTMQKLSEIVGSPFKLFEDLSLFMSTWFSDNDVFLPRRPSDLYACVSDAIEIYCKDAISGIDPMEWLRYDFLLQGKPGTFPAWFIRRYDKEIHDRALLDNDLLATYETRRAAYANTEFDCFCFIKGSVPEKKLFVYSVSSKKERKAHVINV